MRILDNEHKIETPEGIDLALRPAGIGVRAIAYAIDTVLRYLALLVIGMLFSVMGKTGVGLIAICLFLMEWLYPVWFEVMRSGMTPGKKSMGLRVVHDDGSPINLGSSLIRNLLRAVDFLPLMYMTGICSMLIGQSFKRLGDLAAGTLVVYQSETTDKQMLNATGAKAAPVTLTIDEQRALLAFAESGQRLSPQRQAELANLLEPLTGKQNEEGVKELVQYANELSGRK